MSLQDLEEKITAEIRSTQRMIRSVTTQLSKLEAIRSQRQPEVDVFKIHQAVVDAISRQYPRKVLHAENPAAIRTAAPQDNIFFYDAENNTHLMYSFGEGFLPVESPVRFTGNLPSIQIEHGFLFEQPDGKPTMEVARISVNLMQSQTRFPRVTLFLKEFK